MPRSRGCLIRLRVDQFWLESGQMRYRIVFDAKAVHDLRRLRAAQRSEVRDAIEKHLRFEPTRVSKSRIKRLRDLRHPQYRLRVGEVRVFYDVMDEEVQVLAVIAKADVNEWLRNEGVPQ
jgi:mRNA interferase RelE/StbE